MNTIRLDNQSHSQQIIFVDVQKQQMRCYQQAELFKVYPVSTARNGLGEKMNSECTPRGWHRIHSIIGREMEANTVFVARVSTGEIYTPELAAKNPGRDWILTRILRLDGLEGGRNKGGEVDSLNRYIYIHGTPDETLLGIPGSRGCIRMNNLDIIELAEWVEVNTFLHIA
ncbi:L,D-transpeptidase [Legionella londiniensis]|uniref:Putative ErfK/YbiS/YcfS/YnhG protein n=1 Tax=Legionella londiniensis TaxID=45068 RepID=A0A0W0VM20_9GAMM|nr:L,D-transpeptidase [Legionella londiniensis]KTD21151.1 putative ErfK/YbiS/YcfS/YnhG protein [Legionella londiniensis]STX93173.1 putative ErfK/YbiS/YcfS/YnhG protein [Legionella londiniensis]